MWCLQTASSSHWKLDFWKNGHFDRSPKWLSGVDNNFYRTYSGSTSLNLLKKPDMSKIVKRLLYLLHGWKSRFFRTKANVCQKIKNLDFLPLWLRNLKLGGKILQKIRIMGKKLWWQNSTSNLTFRWPRSTICIHTSYIWKLVVRISLYPMY